MSLYKGLLAYKFGVRLFDRWVEQPNFYLLL